MTTSDRSYTTPGDTIGKRVEYDHKHRFKTVRSYDYSDAAALLEDFWEQLEAVLKEEGVRI